MKVIPCRFNVPTATTLESGASSAEVGQYVPLVATVTDAGTGNQVNAGKVEPITGPVAFFTDSPTPCSGQVKLNKNGQGLLSTNMLKNIGPYQIHGRVFTLQQPISPPAPRHPRP